jgi:hypothetical protein
MGAVSTAGLGDKPVTVERGGDLALADLKNGRTCLHLLGELIVQDRLDASAHKVADHIDADSE